MAELERLPADVAIPGGAPLDDETLELIAESFDRGDASDWQEKWKIDDDVTAEWAMRMYAAAVDDVATVDAHLHAYRRSVDAWASGRVKPLERTMDFFGMHLEQYALRRRAETKDKVMSVKLPSGTVGTTKGREVIEVDDEAALEKWLRSKPTLKGEVYAIEIVETFKVAKAALLKLAVEQLTVDESTGAILWDADEGELIPGVRLERRPTTAKVTPA